ncbi:MAG: hypothetical protein RLZZ58_171 [Pseudomonadota bacterium]|jgi:hypothetical protein
MTMSLSFLPLKRLALAALISAASLGALPSAAQTDRDQGRVREAADAGSLMPLPRIVSHVQAKSPYDDMTYLGGPEFEERTMRYRLKFLDGKQVVVVVVDARTGRVVGRAP